MELMEAKSSGAERKIQAAPNPCFKHIFEIYNISNNQVFSIIDINANDLYFVYICNIISMDILN